MDVIAQAPFVVGSITWQEEPDQWSLTVVCKATYALAPGTSPLARTPEAINESDNHWDDDPQRSLYAPSDLAPQKPRPEVLLVGSAYAPRGEEVRSLLTRLVVGTVDKSIEVLVPRTLMQDGTIREGTPWARMPLRYERAAGGVGSWNPVGMGVESVDRHGRCSLPNLQIPGLGGVALHEEIEPVGFGPIAAAWELRRDKLGEVHASMVESEGGARWDKEPLGANFDADYFQTAPLDQLIDELHPDEAIVLENLHPEHADLVTRLPGLRPVARVEIEDQPAWELALVADTLWIDTDRSICTLTWRAQVPLQERDPEGRVLVGVEEPGQPVRWPEAGQPSAPSLDHFAASTGAGFAPGAVDESSPELSHTAVDDHLLAARAPSSPGEVLPFREAAAGAPIAPPLVPRPALLSRDHAWDRDEQASTTQVARLAKSSAMPSWLKAAAPAPAVTSAPALPPAMPPMNVPPPPMLFSAPPPVEDAPAVARAPSAPAYVSVLDASNAAASAPREAATASGRRDASASGTGAPRALQELVWFDPEALPRLRENATWAAWMGPPPAPPPPDDATAARAHARAERAGVAAVLARDAGITDVEAAIEASVSEDGAFEPQLCVVAGELEVLFDEVETLKLLLAAAAPLAPGDKRLKEVVEQAGEVLKTPLGASPEVAASFIARLREAWAKASRILPADYLDHHTRRLLLDQRLYQKRSFANVAWLRALFTPSGASAAVPIYLPAALGPWMPLFTRFGARVLAEAVPQQDQHEACAAALRCFALARVLTPKPRASR